MLDGWVYAEMVFRWRAEARSWGDPEHRAYGAFLTGLVAPHAPAYVEVAVSVRIEPDPPFFGRERMAFVRPTFELECEASARVALRSGESREARGAATYRLGRIGAALARCLENDEVHQTKFEPYIDSVLTGTWRDCDGMPEWWAAADGMPRAAVAVAFGTTFMNDPSTPRRGRLLGRGST